MTTSVGDTIRDSIHEMQTDVELEGGLSILGLVHHNGQGQEVPIQAISNKAQGGRKWGNAEALADMFDACATRHALGCVGGGAQQFTLHACFGTSGKPTRMIPFGKMGLAHLAPPVVTRGRASWCMASTMRPSAMSPREVQSHAVSPRPHSRRSCRTAGSSMLSSEPRIVSQSARSAWT